MGTLAGPLYPSEEVTGAEVVVVVLVVVLDFDEVGSGGVGFEPPEHPATETAVSAVSSAVTRVVRRCGIRVLPGQPALTPP